jgi:thiol-disulfide isomerase/thioredoxin
MNPFTPNVFKVVAACVLALPAPAFGQSPALQFGSPAPALQVKWVKGQPVAAFDKDMVYVIEFWATWCSPCRAAMPHLSEMSRNYAGKVVFIGVNVFEKGAKDAPYESNYPSVKKFVDRLGKEMDYRVAMDTNGTPMAKNWMAAAGQDGIPASFLVKDGRVVWIGHPNALGKVLEEVLKGTYDMAAAAQTRKIESAGMQVTFKYLDQLEKDVNAAIAAKDYPKALDLLKGDDARISPDYRFLFRLTKFTALLKFDVPKAMAYARDETATFPGSGPQLASLVLMDDKPLPAEVYPFCLEQLELFNKQPGHPVTITLHLAAQCKASLSDFAGAAETEKEAIKAAKAAIAIGEQKGIVTAETVKEFEAKLAEYTARAQAPGTSSR